MFPNSTLLLLPLHRPRCAPSRSAKRTPVIIIKRSIQNPQIPSPNPFPRRKPNLRGLSMISIVPWASEHGQKVCSLCLSAQSPIKLGWRFTVPTAYPALSIRLLSMASRERSFGCPRSFRNNRRIFCKGGGGQISGALGARTVLVRRQNLQFFKRKDVRIWGGAPRRVARLIGTYRWPEFRFACCKIATHRRDDGWGGCGQADDVFAMIVASIGEFVITRGGLSSGRRAPRASALRSRPATPRPSGAL